EQLVRLRYDAARHPVPRITRDRALECRDLEVFLDIHGEVMIRLPVVNLEYRTSGWRRLRYPHSHPVVTVGPGSRGSHKVADCKTCVLWLRARAALSLFL